MMAALSRDRLAAFTRLCADYPYVQKGMFYSELFLFLEACWQAHVSRLIESGVKFGFSTRLLRAAFSGSMISIDREPCPTPQGVTFVRGDAALMLPGIVAGRPFLCSGILIDGPKGDTALALKDACLRHRAVRVVAIHDLPRGHGETCHSHDPTYRHVAGRELDALIAHAYAAKYPNGPGLAVWLNPRSPEAQP